MKIIYKSHNHKRKKYDSQYIKKILQWMERKKGRGLLFSFKKTKGQCMILVLHIGFGQIGDKHHSESYLWPLAINKIS